MLRRFFKSKKANEAQKPRGPVPPNWPGNSEHSHPTRHRATTADDGAKEGTADYPVPPGPFRRTTYPDDVFSLPGLPDWGASSALERNFENRDEDLSVVSCIESLWSTKTARTTVVLDRKGQDFDHVVMSKLGLQETRLASGAPTPRSLPGLKAVFSAHRAVSLYQAGTKAARYRTATLATTSRLKPGSGYNAFSVDPRGSGGAPSPWSIRTISSPDYNTGTTNSSSKDVDIQGASDSEDNTPQIAHQLKVVLIDKDDIHGESSASQLLTRLSEVNDSMSKFRADGEEMYGDAEREADDIDAAVTREYGLGDTGPKIDGAPDLQFGLGDAQAVASLFTNPEGPNHASPPLRITCSGDYQELNSNALACTLADDSNQFEETSSSKKEVDHKDCDQEKANHDEHSPTPIMTSKNGTSSLSSSYRSIEHDDNTVSTSEGLDSKTQVDHRDCDQEKANPDAHSPTLIITSKNGSSLSQSSSYQSSEHDDNTVSTSEDLDKLFIAKSTEADCSAGILTIAEPFSVGTAEPHLSERGSAEPDFFSGVKLDPNFTSTPVLIEERRLIPPSHEETSTWPAFDVLQKQNDDYFQLFETNHVVAGAEHKSSYMSGEVFESLNSRFPSSRQTTYSVGFSPKSSNASLNVQFVSCTSIVDNDSESSIGSFVTVTSDDDDEACDSDRSNGGISSTNLSGMVSPVFTGSPLPAGCFNLYRCRDTIALQNEQRGGDELERGIQCVTSEQRPATRGASVSTTTLTPSLSGETAPVEADRSQNLEEETQSATFRSSTESATTEKHLNEDDLQSDQPGSPRGSPNCRNLLRQLNPPSDLSTSLSSSFLSDDSFKTLPLDAVSRCFSFSDSGPQPGAVALQALQRFVPITSTTDMMKSPELGPLRLQNEESTFELVSSRGQTQRLIGSPAEPTAVAAGSTGHSVSMSDVKQLGRTLSTRAIPASAEQGTGQGNTLKTSEKERTPLQEPPLVTDDTCIVGCDKPESAGSFQTEEHSD